MPVYEYVCDDCNERFDLRVASFTQADAAHCRTCDSANIKRQISQIAFMPTGYDIPVSTAPSSGGCCGGNCGCGGHG
jgi:putative FmdB family regulatory protein